MANGISKNPLLDINKVYLNQIAEGSLKSLEKASVLAMSDKPEDQDKAREIKTRFDYQSMLKQKKAKKMKEDVSNWRHDLREIIVTADKDAEEPEIKEKKVKNKITINPEFKEAVEDLGGRLLTVEEVEQDDKKAEQMKKKEKRHEVASHSGPCHHTHRPDAEARSPSDIGVASCRRSQRTSLMTRRRSARGRRSTRSTS